MPYIGNVTTSSNVNGSQINNGTITGDKLSLPFNYDSATLYLDNTNNRVGILTASPSSTLTVDTGGVVSIPLASAATPSLVFGTDTNTGIYSPGADQVAISTGGSGRLFVDASGRIGIGTSSEPRRLHVSNGYSAATSLDGSLVQLISSNAAAGDYAGLGILGGTTGGSFIHFGDTDNAGIGRIGYFHSDNSFRVNTDGSERLRITSAGLVGIGTSSPDTTLDVRGNVHFVGNATARQTAYFANTGGQLYTGVESSTGAGVFTGSSAYAGIIGTNNSTNLQLATNGTVRATLDTSGRVGIGTTSPGVKFTVVGSPGDLAAFSNATDASLVISANSGVAKLTNDAASGSIAFGTGSSGTERARITSDGKLLVGTSSSSVAASLVCQATSASSTAGTQIWLQRGQAAASISTGDTLGRINFADNAGSTFAWIDAQTDGGAGTNDYPGRLVFATTADGNTSPTERFRISSTGAQSSVIPGGSTLYPSFDCRAWVNFNGTGTVAIRGSGNVSSITDNGTGDYTMNFTTAMPDANYALSVNGYQTTVNNSFFGYAGGQTYTTTAVRLTTVNSAFAGTDMLSVSAAIFR